ncbi:hypothetical protein JAAARDRAFT_35781 [Jaapia argillacea MUCL 33604]|uniref:Molybdopterin synthase sulfur carrier subunit n=1 Tax=Jaapia argillacea MUCL 33604 TaxID=933084 RepID=A0A067Q3L2_9AGAM|nr:hypothetical protein JAAARDRAFT_35781 [Jaapia argillacea MUCL 33604]
MSITPQHTTEITVLYFAGASTATGLSSQQIQLPAPPSEPFKLSQLSALLVSLHPATNISKVLETSQWSVDAEMVDDPNAVVLKGGEEVAIIPPVSGG